jgi:hypothetical protein
MIRHTLFLLYLFIYQPAGQTLVAGHKLVLSTLALPYDTVRYVRKLSVFPVARSHGSC